MLNNLTNKGKGVYSVHTISVESRNVAGEELANIMNEYFIDIGAPREKDTDCEIGGTAETSNISSSIMLAPTFPNEISNTIKQINTSVAAGIDEIKPSLTKVVSKVINRILQHVVKIMLQTRIFSDDLKIAKVSMVYEVGKRNGMKHYRPISELLIFSKVFEGVINIRLQNFFYQA